MAQITGGAVRYERKLNTGNYEHKIASAEFQFVIAEGEGSAVADIASAHAVEKAHQMLGLGRPEAKADVNTVAPDPETKVDVVQTPPAADAKPVTRRSRQVTEHKPEAKADPPPVIEMPAPEPTPAPAADEGQLWEAEDVTVAEAPPVKDDEIAKACSRQFEATKNGPAIRALVFRYAGQGQQARAIPQDKRRAFLAELERITDKTPVA